MERTDLPPKDAVRYEIPLSFSEAHVTVSRLGEDISLLFSGGERPHIGCPVLALPRPSLTGDGSVSATSSVINVTGHKDEAVCRYLAEEVCKKTGRAVVCTGGFHVDGITPEQIAEVTEAVKALRIAL
ncbi:MAG: hypothetical protein IJH73_08385 [Lachnospiraceae bacterium]|nr:hypothetical protein [Lachnospiraceae bacterium]